MRGHQGFLSVFFLHVHPMLVRAGHSGGGLAAEPPQVIWELADAPGVCNSLFAQVDPPLPAPAHSHHGSLLDPQYANSSCLTMMAWALLGVFPSMCVQVLCTVAGWGDQKHPLVGRGCWCLVGVCSSSPALLPPPSTSFSLLLPPHSLAQFKDKREPPSSPVHCYPPLKDMESSFTLCAVSGSWRGVPGTLSHQITSARRLLETAASWPLGMIQRQWHSALCSTSALDRHEEESLC